MGIDHTGINVPEDQYASVVAWYEAALAPLGYTKGMSFDTPVQVTGMKSGEDKLDFWITAAGSSNGGTQHIAFSAMGASILASQRQHERLC